MKLTNGQIERATVAWADAEAAELPLIGCIMSAATALRLTPVVALNALVDSGLLEVRFVRFKGLPEGKSPEQLVIRKTR